MAPRRTSITAPLSNGTGAATSGFKDRTASRADGKPRFAALSWSGIFVRACASARSKPPTIASSSWGASAMGRLLKGFVLMSRSPGYATAGQPSIHEVGPLIEASPKAGSAPFGVVGNSALTGSTGQRDELVEHERGLEETAIGGERGSELAPLLQRNAGHRDPQTEHPRECP